MVIVMPFKKLCLVSAVGRGLASAAARLGRPEPLGKQVVATSLPTHSLGLHRCLGIAWESESSASPLPPAS